MIARWELRPPAPEALIRELPDLHPVIVQTLFNRGLASSADIERFLHPDFDAHTHDPYLFRDMEKAVTRIFDAIDANQKIVVHGDYDSDGVCAATVLCGILRDLGADVDVYLPHREKEGYGLNSTTVRTLADNGVKLIVTVDCGISNVAEVEVAREHGVDVIITDHHAEPPELPRAFAIINPAVSEQGYPFARLAGVGVAFKLAQGLARRAGSRLPAGYEKWLLDVVALATVTDMMPLIDENRVFVKYGMIVMQKTKRVGLKLLMQRAGIVLTPHELVNTTHIGFALGPRINASGRINHANTSFELLNATDESEATRLVEELERNNQERQKLTASIVDSVVSSVDEKNIGSVIIAKGVDWPMGLVGLVASKVKDSFNRPTLVMTENSGSVVGSGRSISDFNMIEALQKLSAYFSHYGGHKMACGFTLADRSRYDEFVRAFTALTDEALTGKSLEPVIEVDALITLRDVSWELYDHLDQLQPFGVGNSQPLFLIRSCVVDAIKLVGTNQDHVRFVLRDPTVLKGMVSIAFRKGEQAKDIRVGDYVDVVARVDVNEWNGNRELQLVVQDFRKST